MKNILLILSFLISIPCIAQNKKSFLRDGNELYQDSSYNQAEIKYRKSLEKDQDYFNASFNLADAIYKQERYAESSELFNALKDNAVNKDDLAKIYHNLGNSLVNEQNLDEAIKAYKNALRINPKDEETRYNLALTKRKKQQQENKEDDKKQQEEKQQEEKQQEEKQQEEKQQEEKQQEEKQQEEKQQEEKQQEKMSKEDVEKMLEAIEQKEKELQEELQKKKVKGKKVKIVKDW